MRFCAATLRADAAYPSRALLYGAEMQDEDRGAGPPRLGGLPARVYALRGKDSGLLGQGARFAVAGATVALVYLASTTLLADVVGLPFQAALAIGYTLGLIVHFSLQRVFVWAHGEAFALALHHQLFRYLSVAALQYGVTAASTALLPGALNVATEIVYVVTVVVVTATNFLVFRHGIFHADPADEELLTGTAVEHD